MQRAVFAASVPASAIAPSTLAQQIQVPRAIVASFNGAVFLALATFALGACGERSSGEGQGEARAAQIERPAPKAKLPPIVTADLAAVSSRCGNAPGTSPATAAMVHSADFNGDGAEDYLLDATRFVCPAEPAQPPNNEGPVAVYTSLADGSYRITFEAPYVNTAAIERQGDRAALRLTGFEYACPRGNACGELEDEPPTARTETLRMTDGTSWSTSKFATGHIAYRPNDYPAPVAEMVRRVGELCGKVGRRLVLQPDALLSYDMGYEGNKAIDLNGDGRQDYVVGVDNLQCGIEYSEEQPPSYCGEDCSLVAFVSRPDGSHVEQRLAGIPGWQGNGDGTTMNRVGRKHVLRWWEETRPPRDTDITDMGDSVCRQLSWVGTTAQRDACPQSAE